MSSNKYDELQKEIKDGIDYITFNLNLIYRNKDWNDNDIINLKESIKTINTGIKEKKFQIKVLTNFKKELFKLFKNKMLFYFVFSFFILTEISFSFFNIAGILNIIMSLLGVGSISLIASGLINKKELEEIIRIKLYSNLEDVEKSLENLLSTKKLKEDWLLYCMDCDRKYNDKIEKYSEQHAELIKHSYDVDKRKNNATRYCSKDEELNNYFDNDKVVQTTMKLIRDKDKK